LADPPVARALRRGADDLPARRLVVGFVLSCRVKAASDRPARVIKPKVAKASFRIVGSFRNRDFNNGFRRRIVAFEDLCGGLPAANGEKIDPPHLLATLPGTNSRERRYPQERTFP